MDAARLEVLAGQQHRVFLKSNLQELGVDVVDTVVQPLRPDVLAFATEQLDGIGRRAGRRLADLSCAFEEWVREHVLDKDASEVARGLQTGQDQGVMLSPQAVADGLSPETGVRYAVSMLWSGGLNKGRWLH